MSTITPLPQPRGISAVVATELRALMARYGQTQADLATLLGISPGQMSKRMRGTIAFDVYELDMLARRFNVTVAELVGGTVPHGSPNGDPSRASGWAPRGSNPEPTGSTNAQVIPLFKAA